MPSIMDRLFPGRKPRTPDSISATLDAAREALSTAQARAANATDRRKAAIASGDRSGAIAAEADRATAEIDSEIASGEIAGLEAGLAEAVRQAEAEAKAAAKVVLVKRRSVLGQRYETEWRAAAVVLASMLDETATLQRDAAEAGFTGEIDALPEVLRGFDLHETVGRFSEWLGDALAARPDVPESRKERDFREAEGQRKREKAEADAERARKVEADREQARIDREEERQAQDQRERIGYRRAWRDHMGVAR